MFVCFFDFVHFIVISLYKRYLIKCCDKGKFKIFFLLTPQFLFIVNRQKYFNNGG